MKNYFRITGYYPEYDFYFIIDSNGMFEKLWEFSSYLISKGIKIIAVSKEENMIDINIDRVEYDKEHIFFRAGSFGKVEEIEQIIEGIKYKAIKIADKVYISNKENRI